MEKMIATPCGSAPLSERYCAKRKQVVLCRKTDGESAYRCLSAHLCKEPSCNGKEKSEAVQ